MRYIRLALIVLGLFSAVTVWASGDEMSHDAEHMAVLNLVQGQFVTHKSIQDGDWSDPNTWGGAVPDLGSRVQISAGHHVTLDKPVAAPIRTVRIDGTLSVATNKNVALTLETMVVTDNGSLQIGTQYQPTAANVEVVFIDYDNNGFETVDNASADFDPFKLGVGLIVMGNLEAHGAIKKGYTTFDGAKAGDSVLNVDTVPAGWRVGDIVAVAGTTRGSTLSDAEQHEMRTIVSLTGSTIELDSPLAYDRHLPRHNKADLTLKLHIINLTRNITFSTHPDGRDTSVTHGDSRKQEFTQRGHLMFMHSASVDFRYVALHYLGRTNKRWTAQSTVLNEDGSYTVATNPLARYPLHFHMNYDQQLGVVEGNAVLTSPGFGYVNHSSYARMRDNVAYGVFGSAFVSELGDELGSFIGNIAMKTYGTKTSGTGRVGGASRFDKGHRGESFWIQSRLVQYQDNIAIGFSWAGFSTWLEQGFDSGFYDRHVNARLVNNYKSEYNDVDTVSVEQARNNNTTPLYVNNLAYSGRMGFEDARLRAKTNGFTAHNVFAGQTRWYSGTSDHWNTTVIGDLDNPVDAKGIEEHGNSPRITYTDLHVEGYAEGIAVCRKGYCGVVNAFMNNVTDFTFNKQWNYGSPAYVVGDVRFGKLSDAALAGRERIHFDVEFGYGSTTKSPFTPMVIDIDDWGQAYQVHMIKEQAPEFVPYPTGERNPPVAEWADKDNLWFEQLWGTPIGGTWIPDNAIAVAKTHNMRLEPISTLPVTPVSYLPTYEPLSIAAVSANTENQGRVADLAIDGDPATKWVANLEDVAHEDILFTIELDGQYYVNSLAMSHANGDIRSYYIDVDVSRDGVNFTPVDRYLTPGNTAELVGYPIGTSGVKYIRLRMQGNNGADLVKRGWTNIQELQVVGRHSQY